MTKPLIALPQSESCVWYRLGLILAFGFCLLRWHWQRKGNRDVIDNHHLPHIRYVFSYSILSAIFSRDFIVCYQFRWTLKLICTFLTQPDDIYIYVSCSLVAGTSRFTGTAHWHRCRCKIYWFMMCRRHIPLGEKLICDEIFYSLCLCSARARVCVRVCAGRRRLFSLRLDRSKQYGCISLSVYIANLRREISLFIFDLIFILILCNSCVWKRTK